MDIKQAIELKKKRAFPLWEKTYNQSKKFIDLFDDWDEEEIDSKKRKYAWQMNQAINAYFKMMDCKRIDLRFNGEGNK